MNRFYLWKILYLLIPATLLIACNTQKEAIYLIPEGYTGPVVILFDQPDGVTLPAGDDFNIYKIPKDGTLRIKTSLIEVNNEKFFYEKVNGERAEIDYLYPKGRGKAWEENPKTFDQIDPNSSVIFVMGRVAGTFNLKNEIIRYRAFKVGKASDSEKLYLQTQDKIIEIQKQMRK